MGTSSDGSIKKGDLAAADDVKNTGKKETAAATPKSGRKGKSSPADEASGAGEKSEKVCTIITLAIIMSFL